MSEIISNWAIIVAAAAILTVAITFIVNFFQKPTPQQIEQLKQWLVWSTTEAERLLGSNMGKLKLRYVYDLFLTKFDYLAKIISFEKFSELVDEALEETKRILEQNKSAREYVGIDNDTTTSKAEDTETSAE